MYCFSLYCGTTLTWVEKGSLSAMGLTDGLVYFSTGIMSNGALPRSLNRVQGIFSFWMVDEAELKSLCPSPHHKSPNYTQKRALACARSVFTYDKLSWDTYMLEG